MEELLLGFHVSFKNTSTKDSNNFQNAIQEIINLKTNCGTMFVGPPQSSIRKKLNFKDIEQAKKLGDINNIFMSKLFAHSAYIINLSNTINIDNWKFGIDLMINDINRCEELGLMGIVVHPGSSSDKEKGIQNCSLAINKIFEKTRKVNIYLETTTNKKNLVGGKFEDLAKIIKNVKNKSRIGVCLDTCHIWDAGYDIKTNLNQVLLDFDRIIGLNYLKVIHLNDSLNILGSNKDRHSIIGQGEIGVQTLRDILYRKELITIPKVIESKADFDGRLKEIALLLEKKVV